MTEKAKPNYQMPSKVKQREIILFLNNHKVMERNNIKLLADGQSRGLGFYSNG